jgi:hypothetical protein
LTKQVSTGADAGRHHHLVLSGGKTLEPLCRGTEKKGGQSWQRMLTHQSEFGVPAAFMRCLHNRYFCDPQSQVQVDTFVIYPLLLVSTLASRCHTRLSVSCSCDGRRTRPAHVISMTVIVSLSSCLQRYCLVRCWILLLCSCPYAGILGG